MEKISATKMPRTHSNKPRWHKSKMGYEFDYFEEVWELDGSYKINLSNLRPLDKRTEKGARDTFCRYAEEMSAGTTVQTFNLFNYFLDYTRLTSITTAGISNWLAELSSEEEHKLGALRVLFYHWHDWGFEGVDKDVIKFLDELVLRGAESGVAVKKACPYTGHLTHIEFGAILEWASNQYVKSKLSITEYSYLLILALTGRRAINIRSLRAKDLLVRKHAKGEEYIVNFPRAKQKHTQFRSQFTPVNINKDLYLVMSAQIKNSTSAIENAIGTELPANIRKEIPIFINPLRLKILKSAECFKKTMREMPDYFHLGKCQASTMMNKITKECTAKSERTGDFIHLTAYRFRYTKATNLSRRGIRGVALAAALDHTNTEHIGIYTQNTEEVAEQITELMSPVLASLAQAFAGTLRIPLKSARRTDMKAAAVPL